jgi:hypothetical protein
MLLRYINLDKSSYNSGIYFVNYMKYKALYFIIRLKPISRCPHRTGFIILRLCGFYFVDRLFWDYSVITSHNDGIVSWIISGESAVSNTR